MKTMANKRKKKKKFSSKPFKTEENIRYLNNLLAMEDYKPIAKAFGENNLWEPRFGITSSGVEFENVPKPHIYYQKDGQHVTDGGRTPFEKEAYRNWRYKGNIIDKRKKGRKGGKENHWITEDYLKIDPTFNNKMPQFRKGEIKGQKGKLANKLKEQLESLGVNTTSELCKIPPEPVRRNMKCVECHNVPLPDPVKYTDPKDPNKTRWAHYGCVYRRHKTYEERYILELDKYRPKRKEDTTLTLNIKKSNCPTTEEFKTVVNSADYCVTCGRYLFSDELYGHICDIYYKPPLVPEEGEKDKQSKRKSAAKKKLLRESARVTYKTPNENPKETSKESSTSENSSSDSSASTDDKEGEEDSDLERKTRPSRNTRSSDHKSLRIMASMGVPEGAESSPSNSWADCSFCDNASDNSQALPASGEKADPNQYYPLRVAALEYQNDLLKEKLRIKEVENRRLKEEKQTLQKDNDWVAKRYASTRENSDKHEKECKELNLELTKIKNELENIKTEMKAKDEEICRQKEEIKSKDSKIKATNEGKENYKTNPNDITEQNVRKKTAKQLLPVFRKLSETQMSNALLMNTIANELERKANQTEPTKAVPEVAVPTNANNRATEGDAPESRPNKEPIRENKRKSNDSKDDKAKAGKDHLVSIRSLENKIKKVKKDIEKNSVKRSSHQGEGI